MMEPVPATAAPTPEAKRTACGTEPTEEQASICSMPNELLCRVVQRIGSHPRDLAAAYIASPSLFHVDMRSVVVEWGAVHTYGLIKAGAPLDIVDAAVRKRNDPLYRRIIKAAAAGGRVEVMRYLLDRPGVTPSIPMDFALQRGHSVSHAEACSPPPSPLVVSFLCYRQVVRCRHQFDDGQKDRGKTPKSIAKSRCVTDAIRAAFKRGHVEMARHLVTRKILGQDSHKFLKKTEGIMAAAASPGRLAVLQMAHDRVVCNVRRRPCSQSHVGTSAWESDDERVPRWLMEHGCSGYRDPSTDDIAKMIRTGRVAMLRYALSRHAAANGGKVPVDTAHTTIADALTDAAKEGRLKAITAAIEAGLCRRLHRVLVSALRAGRLDVVEWVASLEGEHRIALDDVRTALVWTPFWESADTDRGAQWLVNRFGADAVVDAGVVYAAFRNWGPNAARALIHLMPADRIGTVKWELLMGSALSQGVDAVRYLVKGWGVRLEGHHFLCVESPSTEVLDFVLAHRSIRVLQAAVDMRGARLTPEDADFVRAVRAHSPSVCASVAVAVSPYRIKAQKKPKGYIESCDCPRCSVPAGASSTSSSAPVTPHSPKDGAGGTISPAVPYRTMDDMDLPETFVALGDLQRDILNG
jgi:hypothetical protein